MQLAYESIKWIVEQREVEKPLVKWIDAALSKNTIIYTSVGTSIRVDRYYVESFHHSYQYL